MYAGHFLTSLDMAGISVTLLALTDEREAALDAPTTAPGWPGGGLCLASKPMVPMPQLEPLAPVGGGITPSAATGAAALLGACIQAACDSMLSAAEQLNDWDRLCGDGDTGDQRVTHGWHAGDTRVTHWPACHASSLLINTHCLVCASHACRPSSDLRHLTRVSFHPVCTLWCNQTGTGDTLRAGAEAVSAALQGGTYALDDPATCLAQVGGWRGVSLHAV